MILRSSLVIRVVLSLCLVLNGLGGGAAAHAHRMSGADQSAMVAVQEPATEAVPARAAESPCHGAHAADSASSSTHGLDTSASPKDTPRGCCDQAGCGGSCLHQPTGPIVSSTVVVDAAPTADAVPTRTLHVSPALPHLTRPPIG